MANSLALENAGGITLRVAAVLLTIADIIHQPSRATRRSLGQIQKSI